jgi:hypothetical protein
MVFHAPFRPGKRQARPGTGAAQARHGPAPGQGAGQGPCLQGPLSPSYSLTWERQAMPGTGAVRYGLGTGIGQTRCSSSPLPWERLAAPGSVRGKAGRCMASVIGIGRVPGPVWAL